MLENIPKITSEDIGETLGTFVVEPLDRGFGYTFGNSLRRVLLSSLEGAAVTSVKIEGVAHEFTSVPGVREDVTDVILNLKNLICRLHGESGEVEVQVQKDGPGKVTAADIEAPSPRDPEPRPHHLPPGREGPVRDDARRRPGPRLRAREGNKGPETTIGGIRDSIFSPVRRVSYDVDAARVGQRTDFDKLKLEVTTNGSMTPKDAVKDAAEILIRYLSIFTDIDAADLAIRGDGAAAEAAAPSAHGMENILIEELELGVRSYNCLKRVGIETIGDLISKTEGELGAIPNFGERASRKSRKCSPGPRPPPNRGELAMRHRRQGPKLDRTSAHRKSMAANLATALLEHGRIQTTEAKARLAADRGAGDHPRQGRQPPCASPGHRAASQQAVSDRCSTRSRRCSRTSPVATRG